MKARLLPLSSIFCILVLVPVAVLSVETDAEAAAGILMLEESYNDPLGEKASFWVEEGGPLSLWEAYGAWKGGGFQRGENKVASYGIAAQAVWMQLSLYNGGTEPLSRVLSLGKPWMDDLEIYLLRHGEVLEARIVGDERETGSELAPGIGYLIPFRFPAGESQIFIRAQAEDPFVLTVYLHSLDETDEVERRMEYGYGLLFGFLIALIGYNLMLYLGFRSSSYLYYALYLASFIGLCMAYSGHGFHWWWPESPGFQRFVILVMMVLFSCCGFLFASRFLNLRQHAGAVWCCISATCITSMILSARFVWEGSQLQMALLAFNYTTFFSFAMVYLGVLSVVHGKQEGCFFLVAAICSMLGVVSTALSTRGVIPLTPLTFHAVEIGMMLEATLLSLALARQMRAQEEARRSAEELSRLDALTGLPNRRAFQSDAVAIWSTAIRHRRPLSLVMLDIDHFKHINDRYGHPAGDRVLIEVGKLLNRFCRKGDSVARWGGEEFAILLPETTLQKACLFADNLRLAVAGLGLELEGERLHLTISAGVTQRRYQICLDDLVREADRKLYESKQGGRDRVSPPVMQRNSTVSATSGW